MMDVAIRVGFALLGSGALVWLFHDWRSGQTMSGGEGGEVGMAEQPVAFAIEMLIQGSIAGYCFWRASGLTLDQGRAILKIVTAHV